MKVFSLLKERLSGYFQWNSLWVLISSTTALIAVAAVLVITAAISSRYDQSINRSTRQSNSQIVDNVATAIDSYLKEMIAVSEAVAELLESNPQQSSLQTVQFFLRDDIDTIAVFAASGDLMLKTDDRPIKPYAQLKQQDWFRSVAPGSTNYTLSSPRVQRLYRGQYPWVISLSKGVQWQNQDDGIQQGLVLVDLNFNNIKELCSKELGDNGYIYILGADGQIVYHPHQQVIYAGITSDDITLAANLEDGSTIFMSPEGRVAVSVRSLKNAEWKIVGVSSLNGFFSYDEEISRYATIIMVSVGTIVILLAALVSFLITRPMRRLMSLMAKVERGALDTFSQYKGVYEVQQLSTSFNQMVYQMKHLMEQVRQEQIQLRKSEMNALQAQINPHFLYNTLDSIVWMAESGDQQNVILMIDALAQFFRLSLAGGKELIPVGDELRHTENYLIIQKIRYSDQFTYTIDAQPAILACKTLKIILQPIVENAVIHGVGNLPYPGTIHIGAQAQGSVLLLQVKDNGYGIRPELIGRILEAKPSSKSGIGIWNVQQRIQLMYGKEYGLTYYSEPDEGTCVTIRLPLVRE
ncbi:sensor histidine kinase [Oscillospiraceae bacterium MB08-C2-2]|nr:sensor histidine kinase [Oscillospiraceae bacterium MB08-C2-2]